MKTRRTSLWNRLKVAARLRILNYLEAGQRWVRGRSYLPGDIRDARFDVTSAERLEVVRKSRYFEANNALANRLCDLYEEYTVGPNGLQVTPASDSDKYNDAADRAWNGWCEFPDLTSLQSFGVLQGLMARREFFDGEIFIIKTQSNSTGRIRPRIQLVETHRVATPTDTEQTKGRTIIDGIEVDAKGRPIAYWIRDSVVTDQFEESKFTRKDAKDVIHQFEPSRPGQYRGLPLLAPVINDLNDLDDLQMFEMQAAKQNAQVTRTVENGSGEDEDENISEEFETKRDADDASTVTRKEYYREVFGSQVHYLKPGDKYKEFSSQRPSVAVQAYWEYLITKICAGVGISRLLVYPTAMQGTVMRADCDTSNAFFRSRSAGKQDVVLSIYEWVMEWETNNNPALRDKPGNWKKATTCAPRAVNADVGRNSAAMLAELKEGATTLEDVYAPLGKNWRERIRQRAREVAVIKYEAQVASSLYPGIEVKPGEVSESLVVEAVQNQPKEPVAV